MKLTNSPKVTVLEAGRRGGTRTKLKYGREHFVRIGKIGGMKSRGGGRPFKKEQQSKKQDD